MIGYVTIGSNNIDAAKPFYTALLSELGGSLMFADEKYTFFGTGWDAPMIALCTPFDDNPATVGNGAMVALSAADRATVGKVHAKALELGATCEGPPGLRGPEAMGFYGAYFRDLDGNKLCAFRMGPEA
jgi:catechol 2,3-dioxygenase-like lactoylglutathione lyase family enzyme